MKKRIVAGLMAGALLLGGTAFADVDLLGMTYDELVSLHGRVIEAMEDSDGAVSFRAEPGEYIVGIDIPVGSYSVRLADGGGYSVFKIQDISGKDRKTEFFDPDEKPDKILGQVILEDGEKIVLQFSAFLFAPPAGITFN